MGSYHYNPNSPLTRWQQEKVYALCGERHPILTRHFLNQERPNDRRLLRHIEREIDWYHTKAMKPGFDAMRERLRRTNVLKRQVLRLVKLAEAQSAPNHHTGSPLSSAFTAEEWAEIRPK